MQNLFLSSRSCTVLLDPEGLFEARQSYDLFLNHSFLRTETRSVASIFNLLPDQDYLLEAQSGDRLLTLTFHTPAERISLDARAFGAKGDGIHDDTPALQAAILSCPQGGRVRVPAGTYRTGPLFLKSHTTLELQKGCTLKLLTDRSAFPVLPGVTYPTGNQQEYLLGSWEGNPLDCYAAALTGIGVEDVRIIGEGVVDGSGAEGDWWQNPKVRRGAWRGRLFYLRDCQHITVQGITFRNSPSWNLHPCFSQHLSFLNIRIEAPYHSPNTDGFDPESCSDIRVLGTVFSVGDDCIAIKAGKIYMGQTYQTPCENMEVAYCAMLKGHGGVTVGSEMAGGVRNIHVHHCLMKGNDRGLRIKSRRGRGQNGVIDNIRFEDIRMEDVKAPLTVNAFYYCDPDGHSSYVQTREKMPVDKNAPSIGSIVFHRVHATGCTACIAWVLGLPERPMSLLEIRDSSFHFCPWDEAPLMAPVMADNSPEVRHYGIHAEFIETLSLHHLTVQGRGGSHALMETNAIEKLDAQPGDLQELPD